MRLRLGVGMAAICLLLPACGGGATSRLDGGSDGSDGSVDGDGGTDDGGTDDGPDGSVDDGGCDYVAPTGDMADPDTSHIAYRLSANGHVYRSEAQAGGAVEDVTALLDTTSTGEDVAIGMSRDGRWIGLLSTRFGCDGWECLSLVATSPTGATASTGRPIMIGGEVVHSEGRPSISRGADFVIFSADGGPHTRDLWLARRSVDCGSDYDAAVLLTGASTYDTHELPALDPGEDKVVCDCVTADGTPSLCTVNLDGSGFTTLVSLTQGPNGVGNGTEVHSGDFLPDGTLVFEGDWLAEQIWHLPATGAPMQVAPTFTNDNSPCAFPDGRVASLWLERPGNPMGYHELKVMDLSGGYDMLVTGVDVTDIGLSCGR